MPKEIFIHRLLRFVLGGIFLSCSGNISYRCHDEEKCAASAADISLALSSVSPNRGGTSGGTVITLTGAGFSGGLSVKVGENSCASVTMFSSST